MSLAFANLHRSRPDFDAAQSDAESALGLVPYWHYVRDILLGRIQGARNAARAIAG